jgi:hypothetical protein
MTRARASGSPGYDGVEEARTGEVPDEEPGEEKERR